MNAAGDRATTMTLTTPPLAAAADTPSPLPAEPLTRVSSATNASAPRHFDFVDSLRGLAIVGVMMVHVLFCIPDFHGRLKVVAAQGQYGVQLFFVVSAFTLFWSLRSRRGKDRRPTAAFFARRLFRIAPLFWIGAMYYLAFPLRDRVAWAPAGVRWPHVLATLAFVHGWYPSTVNSVVPGGWSIGAEVMFYLCIPLLFARVRSLNGAVWLTVVAAWATAAAAGPVSHRLSHHFPSAWGPLLTEFVFYSFPSQLPVFCLGIVLYFLLAEPPASNRQRVGGGALVAVAALAVFGAYGKQVLPSVAFVAVAVGLARRPLAVLVNPVTRFLGTVSFSAYIWHFTVMLHINDPAVRWMLRHHWSPDTQYVGLLALLVGAVVPVATVSYYAVEVPGQTLGKWVINRFQWGAPAGARRGPSEVPSAVAVPA